METDYFKAAFCEVRWVVERGLRVKQNKGLATTTKCVVSGEGKQFIQYLKGRTSWFVIRKFHLH